MYRGKTSLLLPTYLTGAQKGNIEDLKSRLRQLEEERERRREMEEIEERLEKLEEEGTRKRRRETETS